MAKAIITLAIVTGLVGLSQPANAENLQGFNKGFSSRPIVPSAGRPLLQSFYFRFTDADHHFGGVEVAPDNFQARNLKYGYSDKNGDDRYFYNLTINRYFGPIRGYETEREFCRGSTCRFDIKRPTDLVDPIFVIVGFYLQYRGGDHHIKRIGVTESNGFVTVNLNDHNSDDHYSIDLKYAYIPRANFSLVSSLSGTAAAGDRRTIQSGTPVLRGFNLDFLSGDRHIRELGVLLGNSRMEVYYGDKTPNDRFRWRVDYAILR